MKLEIFEKYTRIRIGMIKKYNYITYTDELTGDGTFEIQMPTVDDSVQYLVEGNYIWFEDDIVGIIRGIQDEESEGTNIKIYGYLLNHFLSFRCFIRTTRYYDKVGNVARLMFDELFVNPEDLKRKISFMDMKNSDIHDLVKFPDNKRIQKTGGDLLETLNDVFKPYGLGFEIYPELSTTYDDEEPITSISKMYFRVITPSDRSIGNSENNDPVVFSFDTNNLQRLEYEEDARKYKTTAIVAGEGEGEDRKVIEVGDLTSGGIDRVELYVDARDIQSEGGGGLPEGYTELGAIKHKASGALSLGVTSNANTRIEFGYKCPSSNTTSYITTILGWQVGSYWRYIGMYSPYYYTVRIASNVNANYYQQLSNSSYYTMSSDYREVVLDLNKKQFLIDNRGTEITNTNIFDAYGTIQLAPVLSASYYNYGEYKYIKIYEWENDEKVLKNHFIPCKDSSNNIGFYDIINQTFVQASTTIWEEVALTGTSQLSQDDSSDEEVEEMMEERGEEKLAECVKFISLDCSVIANSMFKYGVDYFKGDYVSVIDNKLNRRFDNVQIVSATKSYSRGVEHLDIRFGYDMLSIQDIKERRA